MGVLSDLFNKIQKKQEQNSAQEAISKPVEQAPKTLTQDEKNHKLLIAVIEENQEESLKMLASGANPNFETRNAGSVILRLAYSVARPKEGFDPKVVFDAAMKAGLDLNGKNSEGNTPLMQIAQDGLGIKTVEQFMQWGHGQINHDLPTEEGRTAGEFVKDYLYRMVYGPTQWGYMKKLGENKRNDAYVSEQLDEIDTMVKSWNMLHAVARGDQAETLKMLNEGADPNYVSVLNGTLVEQLAKTYDNPNNGIDPKVVFDAALDKDLDVNRYDRYTGHTPVTAILSKGVSDKALNGMLQLLDKHLDKESTDMKGKTVESYLQDRQNLSIAMMKKHSGNTY